MILFFHPKSSSEKLLFSVSYDTIESNAKRMKHSLLQFLKHAYRKKKLLLAGGTVSMNLGRSKLFGICNGV